MLISEEINLNSKKLGYLMTLSPCLTCKCMHNPLNDNIAGSRYILESEQLIAPSDTSIKYVK